MWSPSSLIFLALLGVWAAYFLQYWIRRRDHLATARSVEQFSEAMRVLERRDTTPRTDLSEPAPRSWNVHPARATTRPQVLVKRAVAAEPPSPVLTARVDDAASPAARPTRVAAPAESRPREASPAPAAPAAPAAREPRPVPPRIRPSRRVRALLMLVALAELIGIAVLVPLGHLAWWALAPALVALVGSFAYVRAGVRAEHRLRASRRRPARRPGAVRTQTSGAVRAVDTATEASPAAARGHEAPAAAEPAETAPAAATVVPVTDETPVEQPDERPVAQAPAAAKVVEELVVEEHIEYVHLVDEDDIPLTWEPVPVPRPTYTMKARAERPEVSPAEVTPDAAPVELPAEEMPERRVAGA